MAKTMFDPAHVLGKRIVGMSQQGVCEFASKLCGCIEAQVGSQSYRGGIFPENISVDDEGNIVGEGYHHKAGEPHAEVNALAEAKHLARGATAYVTLEPCAHFGRTGPCCVALARAGIKKVVVACTDPNPKVEAKAWSTCACRASRS